ncbi:MAG: beta-N-acetylglucosaminidase domain-containing protein, partial [Terracidiphilus sp.]|nr:beta-N-acetylglucosaminidase domain-containing protein [Terracidiphilus sp.]
VYNWLKSLSPDYRLTVCPTTYNNMWGSRDYIRELGAGLNPEIPIDWTGTDVIPPQITQDEANGWGAILHRKPLVWDNYPTDDGNNALPNVDPLRGRDRKLDTAVAGLFSNPMNQAQLTQIPLQTIADYLWNPGAYDPETSEQHALASQYGPDAPTLLKPLLDTFAAGGAPRARLRSLFEEGWEPVEATAIDADIARLRALIHTVEGRQGFQSLAKELNPIPDELAKQLAKLRADPSFKHLADGRIVWDREREELKAQHMDAAPVLDGSFAKWTAGHIVDLATSAQITDGHELWEGPGGFSAHVALRWDAENLYIGLDVIEPTINQTAFERGIENGDAFRLVLDTRMTPPTEHERIPTLYDLYFSPG